MVLKKQTVWLLTMLSLILVLSVYYMTAPGTEDFAYLEEDEMVEEQEGLQQSLEDLDLDDVAVNVEEGGDLIDEALEEAGSISNVASNEVFATIRNQMIASREEMAEGFTEIIGSADASPELKSEAFTKNQELQQLAQQEATLETLIKAKGYDDVLVLAEEQQVRIIVQIEELSTEQANEIMVMANEQLGANRLVTVGHHTDSK